MGADGIRQGLDNLEAIKICPTKLHNDTQVKQFLGTVNYRRMYLGPDFADLARPLVEITKKSADFIWRDEPTAAVREPRKRRISYTTSSDPETPSVLRTGASDYAIGGSLGTSQRAHGISP